MKCRPETAMLAAGLSIAISVIPIFCFTFADPAVNFQEQVTEWCGDLAVIASLVAFLLVYRFIWLPLGRSKEALRVSELRNRLILDTALDGVILTDAAGRVTEWSQHAEQIFGWLCADAIGQPLDSLIIPPLERLDVSPHIGGAGGSMPVVVGPKSPGNQRPPSRRT